MIREIIEPTAMADKKSSPDKRGGVALKERTKTKRPPMYKVLLHNDDFTTMEFVIHILTSVFHREEADAARITMHVHRNGIGVAGVYTREIAETKCRKVTTMAQRLQFPLQCTFKVA